MRNYLWVDLEMSGLDVEKCRVLEAAAIVADDNFQVKEEYHAVVFQAPEVLAAMDEWCTKTHGESGLSALVPQGKPESQVEQELLELIARHFKDNDPVILCGNSIGQDRKFIDRWMGRLGARLHYRMVDVSSFKEIFKSRYGVEVVKKGGHRAVDDIRESMAELQHYLSFVTLTPKS